MSGIGFRRITVAIRAEPSNAWLSETVSRSMLSTILGNIRTVLLSGRRDGYSAHSEKRKNPPLFDPTWGVPAWPSDAPDEAHMLRSRGSRHRGCSMAQLVLLSAVIPNGTRKILGACQRSKND